MKQQQEMQQQQQQQQQVFHFQGQHSSSSPTPSPVEQAVVGSSKQIRVAKKAPRTKPKKEAKPKTEKKPASKKRKAEDEGQKLRSVHYELLGNSFSSEKFIYLEIIENGRKKKETFPSGKFPVFLNMLHKKDATAYNSLLDKFIQTLNK